MTEDATIKLIMNFMCFRLRESFILVFGFMEFSCGLCLAYFGMWRVTICLLRGFSLCYVDHVDHQCFFLLFLSLSL
jgi:hypothetical protein